MVESRKIATADVGAAAMTATLDRLAEPHDA
jgi:hypothetical protein